jgi:hypothetical protein
MSAGPRWPCFRKCPQTFKGLEGICGMERGKSVVFFMLYFSVAVEIR